VDQQSEVVVGFPVSTEATARFHIRKIDMAARIIVGIVAAGFLFAGLYRVRQGI
jgi:hypothetical protein